MYMLYFMFYVLGSLSTVMIIHLHNKIKKREEEKIDLANAVMYSAGSWFTFFYCSSRLLLIVTRKDSRYKELNKKFRGCCEDD